MLQHKIKVNNSTAYTNPALKVELTAQYIYTDTQKC